MGKDGQDRAISVLSGSVRSGSEGSGFVPGAGPRVIGVDIGGTNVRAGLVEAGRVVGVARRRHRESPYGTHSSYANAVQIVVDLVAELDKRHGRADGVGLSISGVLSADRRSVVSNCGLGWFSSPVVDDVEAGCGRPVVLENDGNCATWAEYAQGVGQGNDPFVLLSFGTGVGGGTVVDGKLVRGWRGAAGELGHICVEAGGRACPCGAIGCLEQYASGPALLRAFNSLRREGDVPAQLKEDDEGLSMGVGDYEVLKDQFGDAVRAGDPVASAALAEVARHVAVGVSALVRVCDPAMLALGGGVSSIGTPFVEAVREALRAYPSVKERVMNLRVELARYGEDAGVLGAGLLCEGSLSGVPGGLPATAGRGSLSPSRGRKEP